MYQFKKPNYFKKTSGIIAVMVLGVFGFIGFKLYPIIHGPVVTIPTLADGATVHDPLVTISGTAKFTQELSVNGKVLKLSPEGTFSEKFLLNQGYNLLTVTAQDRYGTSSELHYRLVLEEPTPTPVLSINNPSEPVLDNSLKN